MIQQATMQFLRDLAEHNDKPWFDANRPAYEAARAGFKELVSRLLERLAPLEPGLEGQKAADCIFRLHRDVRFSKNKQPYKTHFGAYFARGGRKSPYAGYYLHLEPGASFAGGGMWAPESPALRAVRQEIDYNPDEFRAIVEDKGFVKLFGSLEGERLKTAPQGFDTTHPLIDYLKLKSFTVGHPISDEAVTGKALEDTIVKVFSSITPLVLFLNRALD
jgi:uncharacterized protein (TIGR02453 family)